MTMEMGRVTLGAAESPQAEGLSGEAVATAVAQVNTPPKANAQTNDDLPDLAALAELERIAPGSAKTWIEAALARDKQRRLFRLLGLLVTMVLAVFAIGFGQWALVNGATSEALFLSGTGLVGLVGAFLSKR